MTSCYYISGPMLGYPENNFPAFAAAEQALISQGFTVFSPHTVDHGDTTEWAGFLRKDLMIMLERCDGLVLLKGWPQSQGARLELSVAQALGWPVFYFDGEQLIDMNKAAS